MVQENIRGSNFPADNINIEADTAEQRVENEEMASNVAERTGENGETTTNIDQQTAENEENGANIAEQTGENEENTAENGEAGENNEEQIAENGNEEEEASRAGSTNIEDVFSEDNEEEEEPPRKRKYQRHTSHQIEALEAAFKENPHPDERSRTEIADRLGLETRQIKFWFQNRRTQLKAQVERHENVILRQEHDKLIAENVQIREALSNPSPCSRCGGLSTSNEDLYYDEARRLIAENARLKNEIDRFSAINQYMSRTCNALGSWTNSGQSVVMRQSTNSDQSVYVDLALAAFEELFSLVRQDCSLWIRMFDGKEFLNEADYLRTHIPCIGRKPNGFVSEASRSKGFIRMNTSVLVDSLMNVDRWQELFPNIVANAVNVETISSGINGTSSGVLQLIVAQFQVPTPLVPLRQVKFLRYCKQQASGLWAVVDVSVESNQDGLDFDPRTSCRRLPSGCIIQELPNNWSRVTWIEHSEYDESPIHNLCRLLVRNGFAFGARRWVATLQRRSESSFRLSSSVGNNHLDDGRRNLVRIADRMVTSFGCGVSGSGSNWERVYFRSINENVQILIRRNADEVEQPQGTIISACTSVWMPLSKQRLFDFMSNDSYKNRWDILSRDGVAQVVRKFSKNADTSNSVSLLCIKPVKISDEYLFPSDCNMMLVQETCNDASGALVVYAPLDSLAAGQILNSTDPGSVALLPSGFAILPDGQIQLGAPVFNSGEGSSNNVNGSGGCILTVGFQILSSTIPAGRVETEILENIQRLLLGTVERIRTNFL